MKYKRLLAEMFVSGVSKEDMAKLLGKTPRTINNKLNGKTPFYCEEVIKIMDTYFPNRKIDYIFFNK